jgi:hypothetical protein
MKMHGGVDIQIHIFSISALLGNEWSASRPGRYELDWRLGEPKNQSVRCGEETNLDRTNSDPSAVQPVASRYTD